MNPIWQPLSFPSVEDLRQVRAQCHQAIQNVAAVGRSFSAANEQDAFGTLRWSFELQRLVGHWVKGSVTFRSSISIKNFEVYLVDENIRTLSSMPMQNVLQTDVMVWLEHDLSKLGVDCSRINLAYPYEIPAYPMAKKTPFYVDNFEACGELSRLFHNTALVLSGLLKGEKQVSAMLCCPHHFDLSVAVTLLDTGDPETSRCIYMGLSPGDGYYDEPYFYVTPRPYPMENLLDVSRWQAHWHQEDWVGVVLPASCLAHSDFIQVQEKTVKAFFSETFSFLKTIV